MIPNVNKKNFSTTEAILQQLRNDINNLHYNDQFITEAEVSSRFQVSRTPAREALGGWIVFVPFALTPITILYPVSFAAERCL